MARKHKAHKRMNKKGGMHFGKILQILGGAAIAGVYEVFISPMIPFSRNIKNMIEFAVGILLAVMPKMPMLVRSAGVALATINAFEFIVPLLAGTKNATSGGDLAGFLQG